MQTAANNVNIQRIYKKFKSFLFFSLINKKLCTWRKSLTILCLMYSNVEFIKCKYINIIKFKN